MASFIPFVNTQEDCRILNSKSFGYKDAPYLRVSLETIANISKNLPEIPLWVDSGVDGYEHYLKGNQHGFPSYLDDIAKAHILADSGFVRKPKASAVELFVNGVLDKCNELEPTWITVPQLPIVDSNDRNKINALLATATRKWKTRSRFKGSFILPVVFTHQDQLHGKTKWRPRIDNAINCYKESDAKRLWVVDSSLSDQLGTKNFRDRFAWLIELHQYVKHELSAARVVSGPYWGLNLVLWAKGLCEYPGICLGTAYQYYLTDGFKKKGKSRIAIPPLLRTVVVSTDLAEWFEKALASLSSEDNAYKELNNAFKELKKLRDQYSTLLSSGISRNLTAKFYSDWLNRIEKASESARSLALYQDFSSAYVLGKQLPSLPRSGAAARRPERVAEYFMLNCL